VPSAEQVDNRRRGRAEDRIPQIAQDGMCLLTFPPLTQSGAGRTAGGPVESRPARSEVRTALGSLRELPNCPTGGPLETYA
jgi:hypothetical protein